MVTPDAAALADAERAYKELTGREAPTVAFAFGGDMPDVVESIAHDLRRGTKRATVGLVDDYARDGEAIPQVGDTAFVLDVDGVPYAAYEVTRTERAPIGDVTPAFAWDEGEDDRSVESWRRGHRRYFEQYLPTVGVTFSWELDAIFEHFRLTWPTADPAVPPVLASTGDGSIVAREATPAERPALARTLPGAGGLPLIGAWNPDGDLLGAMAFRPREGYRIQLVVVEADDEAAPLQMGRALAELQERHTAMKPR